MKVRPSGGFKEGRGGGNKLEKGFLEMIINQRAGVTESRHYLRVLTTFCFQISGEGSLVARGSGLGDNSEERMDRRLEFRLHDGDKCRWWP